MDNKIEKNLLKKIKCKYLLIKIFDEITENKKLGIIKYNKDIQTILNIGLNDYQKFTEIEIELNTINKNYKNTFINISKDEQNFYHIYFNDNKKEVNKTYFTSNKNVTKIKIIIDFGMKTFYRLFYGCDCIEKINFIKFNRKNIVDMSYMFGGCSSLKEINLTNFKTDNVKKMWGMFSGCSDKLKKKIKENYKNISYEAFF